MPWSEFSLTSKLACSLLLLIIYQINVVTRTHIRTLGSSFLEGQLEKFTNEYSSAKAYYSAATENKESLPNQQQQYDAVVVGAGWAGLRAAKSLLDAGVSNILVLEANEYIGGRSKTMNQDGSINQHSKISTDNIPMEMGSEWLYTDNSMERYLRKNGLLENVPIIDPRGYFVPSEAMFFEQVSRRGHIEINGSTYTERVQNPNKYKDKVWKDFQSFRKHRLKMLGNKDESWGEAMDAYKKEATLTTEESQYFNLLRDIFHIEYNADSNRITLDEQDIFNGHIPETRYMGIRGLGFGNVAHRFGEQFRSKIMLKSKVTEISNYQNRGEGSTVTYTRDGETIRVSAKAVLVTVSLGVLKANIIKFTPSLPEWKQTVIDNMGFGVMNKCAMYWNNAREKVWPDTEFWFELISSGAKWTSFFNPSSYKGTPSLVAWIGGSDASQMEQQTNDGILDQVMKNLQAMFPRIQPPDKVIITRWSREENILGTYSYKAVHRDIDEDAVQLKKKIGRLWFAGEAMAGSDWHATTVGAWKTGEEAAKDIAQMLMPVGLRGSRNSK